MRGDSPVGNTVCLLLVTAALERALGDVSHISSFYIKKRMTGTCYLYACNTQYCNGYHWVFIRQLTM